MPGYENMPVLMLTGLDDDASITRAYQAGATDFFVKSHAVEPAGRAPALPAARLAHAPGARAQQGQAGARAGPGAHGQLRLAARRTPDRRPG
ncbi:MAG: hypothetical protein MZW92_00145 [Comamonadaceae bacterium]|nr:hypothetical protein [Comamonadaceae bacterium]